MDKSEINPKSQILIIICLLFVISLLCIGILPAQENNHTTSSKSDKEETPKDVEVDNLKVNGLIKTEKGLCLKGDCKTNWPALKCADYDSRPAGESGDSFCSSIAKTCFAVSIGSGASYFSECSTPPASPHKTRCCWVE